MMPVFTQDPMNQHQPFLVRFARVTRANETSAEDDGAVPPKPGTIITEVRRETTDDQ